MRIKRHSPDFILFYTTLVLVLFGIVMVYSASSFYAHERFGSEFHFLKRQIIWAIIGFAAMVFFMNFRYWHYQALAPLILVCSLAMLVLVLIPGIGVVRNNARRWLGVGNYTVQPSEIAKLALVIYFSHLLAKKGDKVRSFAKGVVPVLAIMGLFCGLIVLEPDLGTAASIGFTTYVLLFVAGVKIWQMGLLGLAGVGALYLLTVLEPYRMERYLTFWDPWKDRLGSGYQLIQSLYALGPGGLLGLGLGRSRQKLLFLPEPHTDFIFSIIGEELGFIGASFVILMFFVLVWRGFRAAVLAPDRFGTLLAIGITSMIALQAAMNIMVATASMPVTGIPLPLISYGGSSLIFIMSSIGILLNISRYSEF